jgi:hypothetical protein
VAGDDEEKTRRENARTAYDHAQELAEHSDYIMYEVAAIVWSANALLIGFLMEVPRDSVRPWLIISAVAIGCFITLYVPLIFHLTKIGQMKAFEICRKIEDEEKFQHRLHTEISQNYPRLSGRIAVWFLTTVFIVVWLTVPHKVLCGKF